MGRVIPAAASLGKLGMRAESRDRGWRSGASSLSVRAAASYSHEDPGSRFARPGILYIDLSLYFPAGLRPVEQAAEIMSISEAFAF